MSSPRSTNFEFLRVHFPTLTAYAAEAEQHLDEDSDSSGVKLRRFAEAVVEEIFRRDKLPRPLPDDDLARRIQHPPFRRAVGDTQILADLDSIRRDVGNKGAHHGSTVEKAAALDALRAAHRLGHWLMKRAGHATTDVAFVRPPPGGARGESAAEHKRKAKEAKSELGRIRSELSVLAPDDLVPLSEQDRAQSSELIAAYCESLIDSLERRTSTYVAGARADELSAALTDISQNRIAVIGGAGIGKSWIVRRAASAAAATDTVIFAEAKYFNGDLDKWLDATVAAHTPRGAGHLVRVSEHLARRLVVFIDGFDEVPQAHSARLEEVAAALVQRRSSVVVAVARRLDQIPRDWTQSIVNWRPWTADELRELAAALAAPLPEAVLTTLRTPFDVSLAARAAAEPGANGAYDLIERFVRLSFTSSANQLSGLALGRELEGMMRAELRSTAPEAAVQGALTSFVNRNGVPLAAVGEFLAAPFLEVSQGYVSFAHPNFKAFFHAHTSLFTGEPDVAALAETDRDAAQLLLSGPISDASARRLIAGLGIQSGYSGGVAFRSDSVANSLNSDFGERVRALVEADLEAIWDRESVRIREVTAGSATGAGAEPAELVFTFAQELPQYDSLLFSHLSARSFEPGVRLRTALLLDTTYECVTRVAEQRLATAGAPSRPRRVRGHVLWSLLTMSFAQTGAGILCRRCRTNLAAPALADAEVPSLIAELEGRGVATFYWLLNVLQKVEPPAPNLAEALPGILDRARESSAQVAIEALHLAHNLVWSANDEQKARTLTALDAFPTNDPFTATLVLEARQSAGESFEFSVDTISEQLDAALQKPHDADSRQFAYRLYSSQFEELGGEAHAEAIGRLRTSQKVRLLAMAALASPSGFWLASLIGELIQTEGCQREPLSAEALRQAAVVLNLEDAFVSDSLAASIIASAGLAWLGLEPVKIPRVLSSSDEVMFLVAELHYLAAKCDFGARATELWDRLDALVDDAAAIVCFDGRTQIGVANSKGQLPSLLSDFPVPLRRFLHKALARRTTLKRRLIAWKSAERVIEVLGSVGNSESRALLLPLKDDAEFGRVARAAIVSIDARRTD